MNWKINLVLLFTNLRKPLQPNQQQDIPALRRKANRSAWLGKKLFDSHVHVSSVINTSADGVPIRIYSNNTRSDQPVMLFFHGGGFVLYDLESHDNACRRLCKMNDCIVVSVDYRLAPEHTFPAAHDDAYKALHWVRKNIHTYGGSTEHLMLIGDSAGGNLAACMAHRCKKENIKITAQILIYPWIDGKLNNPSIDQNGKGYLLEKDTVFWYQKQYTPRKEDQCLPQISPCYEKDFAALAPAFIITAQYDPLLDDGYNYYKQLIAGGTFATYKKYGGLFHGFFNIPGVHSEALKCYYDIAKFVKSIP